MNKRVFITTAIDYINGQPHLGHALEKIQADVLARYFRQQGREVYFLSGTDENSLKNVQAAEKANKPILDFVNEYYLKFYDLKKELNLSYDDFIRTTEPRHALGVNKLWQACKKDIYMKEYTGLYCVGCEAFYTEDELIDGLCPEHKTKPELITENNYFFKLSEYQERLDKALTDKQYSIIPDSRLSETLSFVHSGLKDICVSRLASRSKGWGIKVPDDLNQTIWVWFDALSNYINAVGYGEDQEKFKKWWQESEVIHVVGKGVSRFHAVYWPAMLLSAGLKLPDKLFVHGYITIEGEKMSKSLGKTVDPVEMAQKYGSDILRYYLLREIPAYEDGDFSEARLKERYNTDLANGLGNLLARVLALAESNEFSLKENDLEKEIQQTEKQYHQYMSVFRFNEALNEIWRLISKADEYISIEKPWEKKNEPEKIIKNISSLVWVLAKVADMLNPFMPKTSDLVLRSLQLINQPMEKWPHLKLSLKKEGILFPRI